MKPGDLSDGAERYPHVFRPIRVGNVEIANRIFVPAHTTNYGENHLPTDRHVEYHRARARGGAGLIIFESIRVHPTSLGKFQGIAGFDPRCVEPFRRVAAAVHEHGAKLFGQIIHLGRQIDGDHVRVPPWGASPVAWDPLAPVPHVMDENDIAALVAGHVASARNVLEAGLDGIEVHLGHGHLLQQFLSPASNRRTDRYGGDEARRMRLPLEVLAAVREAVGPEICLGVRVSADEYLEGGLGIEDMERIVPAILDAVALDFVNVSHSAYHGSRSLATQMADMAFSEAPFRDLTRRIRRALRSHDAAVMAVCKYRTLDEAEATLGRGDTDLVGMARAHIADPNIVKRSVTGAARVRSCIGCNQGCAGFLEKGLPITCLVNPTAGREAQWSPSPEDDPAPQEKRVLVIGAGPAGLEAAWVAAARGHRVHVWERSSEPGGQLLRLRSMPLRHDFLRLVDDQLAACGQVGVVLETGVEATPEKVAEHEPDAVILATGSSEQAVIFDEGGRGLTLGEALDRPWLLGSHVAFYDAAGSWAAVSTAEHLARLGIDVSYLVPTTAFAWNVTVYSRPAVIDRLRRLGVKVRPARRIRAENDGRLEIEDLWSGAVTTEEYDSVVAAGPGLPRDQLGTALSGLGLPLTSVGDCVAPRTALEAVYEGHAAGRAV